MVVSTAGIPAGQNVARDGYKLCVGMRSASSPTRNCSWVPVVPYSVPDSLSGPGGTSNAIQLYEAGCSGVGDWKAWWHGTSATPRSWNQRCLTFEHGHGRPAFNLARNELVYVDFDREQRTFVAPPVDDDRQLLELTKTEAAHVEDVLAALPPHAFERWSSRTWYRIPRTAARVLYARIEELLGEEPVLEERDLLTAIARDLGRPPDKFAADTRGGRTQPPKTRVYLDVLRRVQDKLRKAEQKARSPSR